MPGSVQPLRLGLLTAALAALAAPAAAQPAGPSPGAPAAPAVPVQSAEQLKACLARYRPVGVPVLRSDAPPEERAGRIVCRRGYALSFDTETFNPDWVIERLTPAELKGTASRKDNFAADPFLGVLSPTPADYKKSGFDRGHQAPAGDARFDQGVMDQSFMMTNMSPQVGIGFNRGQWKFLEEAVRAWVLCGGHEDVIVMTGPIYGDSARTIGTAPRLIRVPEAYYKIVYDVHDGRAVGFRLDNVKHGKSDLQTFVVPIARIEVETGIDFFPALTRRKQTQIETPKGIVWGHDQACSNTDEG